MRIPNNGILIFITTLSNNLILNDKEKYIIYRICCLPVYFTFIYCTIKGTNTTKQPVRGVNEHEEK